MKLTPYRVLCEKTTVTRRIAVVADVHADFEGPTLPLLRQAKPDLILIPGDLTEQSEIASGGAGSLRFLSACRELAPVVYTSGNHEVGCFHSGNPVRPPSPIPLPTAYRKELAARGILSLENEWREQDEILFCGLGTGIGNGKNEPNSAVLASFRALPTDRPKILLCHHPEYYPTHLRKLGMDLIVCGHAHGGQWRLFGRGVYAPGQGLFPRYTAGLHGGHCVISRGASGHTRIPRIFNEPEIPLITFGPSTDTES